MKTEANDRKPYQVLTEKQIIKQLKCLIAKQQEEINKLIGEIERLKRAQQDDFIDPSKDKSIAFSNLESSRELQKKHKERQHLSKNSSSHASVIHSKNSTSRSHKQESGYPQNESVLKGFQKYIKDFTVKVLQPFNDKYLNHSNRQETQIVQQDCLKLEANFKDKNYENLIVFSEFFPSLLQQIKTIIKHIDHLIEQKSQKQQFFQKKMKEQEKTLKQMISEYERNIIDSQKMESKLMEQINRLKSSNSNQYFAQTIDFSRHNYK